MDEMETHVGLLARTLPLAAAARLPRATAAATMLPLLEPAAPEASSAGRLRRAR